MTALTTAASPTERVALGAKLLDEKHPGWFRNISRSLLSVSNCHQCVLAQLSGHDYGWGAYEVLGLRYETEADSTTLSGLGFDILRSTRPDTQVRAEFRALTDAWDDEITKRLAA